MTRARRTASADWWITPGTAGMRPRDLFTTSRDYQESVGPKPEDLMARSFQPLSIQQHTREDVATNSVNNNNIINEKKTKTKPKTATNGTDAAENNETLQNNTKPPYSYVALITMAIENSEMKEPRLAEIYVHHKEFPFTKEQKRMAEFYQAQFKLERLFYKDTTRRWRKE
ncbi:hypothetical protein EVAR_101658_1, partial [Eumeta japonica]